MPYGYKVHYVYYLYTVMKNYMVDTRLLIPTQVALKVRIKVLQGKGKKNEVKIEYTKLLEWAVNNHPDYKKIVIGK